MHDDIWIHVIQRSQWLGEFNLSEYDLSGDAGRDDLVDDILVLLGIDRSRLRPDLSFEDPEPWREVKVHFFGCDEQHESSTSCNGALARRASHANLDD